MQIVSLCFLGLGAGMALVPTMPDMLTSMTKDGKTSAADATEVVSGVMNSFIAIGEILGPLLGSALVGGAGLGYPWGSSIFGFLLLANGFVMVVFYFVEAGKASMASKKQSHLEQNLLKAAHSINANVAHA
jgi:MFS family permease